MDAGKNNEGDGRDKHDAIGEEANIKEIAESSKK
jgi:hypothetical protein